MNRYISKELNKRFAEWASHDKAVSERSSINLTLSDYMKERKSTTTNRQKSRKLDRSFKAWAKTQIRLFLFAGHDSTSSSICYCYYLHQHNAEAMCEIRHEHDRVFGSDLATPLDLLSGNPDLLNKLPYTDAVFKEAMRLFPAASAMRGGRPDVSLQDPATNRSYSTSDKNIWIIHSALHRNPKYWPSPNEFIPKRWLVDPSDPLYPVKGAWRLFEHGPRNCLGQTLAMLNIKITLVLTLREFDIREVYDEWDKLRPENAHMIKHFDGERAYQIASGGAHPSDGYPCRVSFRKV